MRDAIGTTKEISEAELVAIMDRYPTLGSFGFGTFGQYHPEFPSNNPEELKRDRDQLRSSVNQFQKACEWLSEVEKSKSINRRHSSYGLKHQLERCYNPFYCFNGALIAAAIFLGFEWNAVKSDAYFNLEQKSLDRLLNANN